jgi:hypothetical protein
MAFKRSLHHSWWLICDPLPIILKQVQRTYYHHYLLRQIRSYSSTLLHVKGLKTDVYMLWKVHSLMSKPLKNFICNPFNALQPTINSHSGTENDIWILLYLIYTIRTSFGFLGYLIVIGYLSLRSFQYL